MKSLLRLLRAGVTRLAIRRRKRAAKKTERAAQGAAAAPSITILSYDSFR